MTRMIERWFPCAEVSANSAAGWGSGNQEREPHHVVRRAPDRAGQGRRHLLAPAVARRRSREQQRLQDLVQARDDGRYAAWDELRAEIETASHPDGASVLDPFSGRGMIPLEAARLGLEAHALDYSPVPYLASRLLTDFPFRDWTAEPRLPFDAGEADDYVDQRPRLVQRRRRLSLS